MIRCVHGGHVDEHVHDVQRVPEDGVVVEVLCRVEPQVGPLLPAPDPLREHVGLHQVRLPADVAQELEVDLVVPVPRRRRVLGCQLHHQHHRACTVKTQAQYTPVRVRTSNWKESMLVHAFNA